jgi:hypothetical protein
MTISLIVYSFNSLSHLSLHLISTPLTHSIFTQVDHHRGLLFEWIEYHRLIGVQHNSFIRF